MMSWIDWRSGCDGSQSGVWSGCWSDGWTNGLKSYLIRMYMEFNAYLKAVFNSYWLQVSFYFILHVHRQSV